VEDIKIRDFVENEFPRSWISKVIIRKTDKEWELIIFSSKIGVLMGKQWNNIKEIEAKLKKNFLRPFKVSVKEVRVPELSAKVMWEFIAQQLESRMPYRRVAKTVLKKVMEKWAVWVKVQIWGRLGGTDIARTEKFIEWKVSLQTFRADVDYHYLQAMTKYGVLWVKVWIEKDASSSAVKQTQKFDSKKFK